MIYSTENREKCLNVMLSRELKIKSAIPRINFRCYYRCTGFFKNRCHSVIFKGDNPEMDIIEEMSTGRYGHDNNKTYYFENEADAIMFRLRYGV